MIQPLYDFFKDHPERWTKGVVARDSDRVEREPCSKHAVCWCLVGARRRLDPTDRPPLEGQNCKSYPCKTSVIHRSRLERLPHHDVRRPA